MSESDMTLGEEICDWIERTCRVPEGALLAQPIQLMPWQRDAIRRTYDNPHGTRRCIISVGRKSGKTTYAACLLLAHLAGPLLHRAWSSRSSVSIYRMRCRFFVALQQEKPMSATDAAAAFPYAANSTRSTLSTSHHL
jgi:hypothetical protein